MQSYNFVLISKLLSTSQILIMFDDLVKLKYL